MGSSMLWSQCRGGVSAVVAPEPINTPLVRASYSDSEADCPMYTATVSLSGCCADPRAPQPTSLYLLSVLWGCCMSVRALQIPGPWLQTPHIFTLMLNPNTHCTLSCVHISVLPYCDFVATPLCHLHASECSPLLGVHHTSISHCGAQDKGTNLPIIINWKQKSHCRKENLNMCKYIRSVPWINSPWYGQASNPETGRAAIETRRRRIKKQNERRKCNRKHKIQTTRMEVKVSENSTMTGIILSSIVWTPKKQQILSSGLSYCPTSKMKYAQTRVDIFKFVRKLKLAKYHLLKTREQPERVGSPTDVANLQICDLRLLRELQELKNETLGTFQHMEDQHENVPWCLWWR